MRTLYLLNIDGNRYGIWKDEIASITDVQTVHRIPLSPDCIAGVSVIEGRSTALADLGACIGLRDHHVSGGVKAFFVAGKKSDSGFVISGEVKEMEVPPDAVHPLPGYLKTPGNDTCVLHGHRPIPVINLTALYDRIHERSTAPSAPALSVPAARPPVPAEIKKIHLFRAGGELFAFPAAQVPDRPAPVLPGSITGIALAPRYVKGLACHQKGVLPVIGLAERMGLAARGTEELMAVADLSGARFGFLIDEYRGSADGADIRPLPHAASTGWASAAVLYRGEVIPLLEPAVLLAETDHEEAVRKLPGQYSPDARFLEAFERTNVNVMEFSLLGVRHALPGTEVEDVVPFKPYRRVPDSLPIVIGITEHNGAVLPVLDLAMVFGRRSLETPEWKLILVKNGDFRAFIITERLYDERILPRDIQRKVPIVLPHDLVYGCYPEGVAVRLILNVEALTVHFDKSVVRDLLPALTSEMAAAPSELVPSLLPEEHLAGGSATASYSEDTAQGDRQAGPEAGVEQTEDAMLARTEAEQLARLEAEAKARAEAEENLQRARDEELRRQAEVERSRRAEEDARRAAEEKTRQETEEERKLLETAERTRREAEEQTQRLAEEQKKIEEEALARREEEERARREAEELLRRTEEEAARHAAEE
ncbi:MAG TPA: chemotaxis protein CheW, partial [Nitrospirota bacterium]|nr:chemotaxis protein CheW [Nitrospirota bacterium]